MPSSRTDAVFLALLAGCTREGTEPVTVSDLAAEVAPDMPTVLVASWTTSEAVASRVVFGVDGAFDRTTPLESTPSTEHTAVLVGLPQGAEVSLRVEAGEVQSDEITATTGAFSSTLPELTLEGEGTGLFMVLPLLLDEGREIVLLDSEGRITWHHTDTRAPEVFRARASRDGAGVIYASTLVAGIPREDSALIRVSWDGSTVEALEVPFLAHDFVELPDGTLVSLVYETRDGVMGNKLVSVDADGSTTDLWSTWDCYDPVSQPGDDPEHGWTHANALDYDPVADVFLIGLRSFSTIVAVDRSGACTWAIGGDGGTLEVDGADFLHEHQFEKIDGGLLVFDNEGAPGNESRVIEYSLDLASGTAAEVGTIHADPPVYSFILGDVHRVDDGDTVVVWSVTGLVDRIAPDGTRVARLEAPNGVGLGFAQMLEDPLSPPADQ